VNRYVHVIVCLLARVCLWVNLIDLKHMVGENKEFVWGRFRKRLTVK
jgi:hypothetical protein